ncbi:helicase C-terminal domain-containing protein [Sulfuricystis multivorans]|uniref:helicase C-terminal domain-containing protein n=1 Tax=Sulfuricystis multivorans TaxID=2211108 RepID=UPI000F824399|nr:helicase C-terminal domain-containing protein [Sulfuricystis multivorans]
MGISIEEVFAACDGLRPPTQVQIDYSRHVLRSIECSAERNGGEVLIEASTGVGKTIGYLIPAMLTAATQNGRVIVSTYTKSLQKQVEADAAIVADGIEKVTGKRLKVARFIGRGNFFDIDRVIEYRDAAAMSGKPDDVVKEWDALIDWLNDLSTSGEIDDYLEENGRLPEGVSKSSVCADAATTSVKHSKMVESVIDADVIITNHAMLCMAAAWDIEELFHGKENQTPIRAVIADEGDRLTDAAKNIVVSSAPFRRILTLSQKAENLGGPSSLSNLTQDIYDYLCESYHGLKHRLDGDAIMYSDVGEQLKEKVKEYYHSVKEIFASKEWKSLKMSASLSSICLDIESYISTLAMVTGEKSLPVPAEGVLSYSPERHFPSIEVVPIYPARVVSRAIKRWRDADDRMTSGCAAFIVTSATLQGANQKSKFWEISNKLGIFDTVNPCADLHKAFSPREFGKLKQIVLADPSVHKPYDGSDIADDGEQDVKVNEEWLGYIARMVKSAANTGRFTLALVNSYRVASEIKIELDKSGVSVPVVLKHRGVRLDSAVKALLAKGNGVLVTPAGWEGLDARSFGFSWDNVVICQLPLVSNDAHRKVIVDYLISKGKSREEALGIVYGDSISSAFRKMKQGIGRGIRSETDEFSLWLGDPRIAVFGSVTETDDIIPDPVNRTYNQFRSAIPQRFSDVPTRILLKDGTLLS